MKGILESADSIGLMAHGPAEACSEELMLYGQFVGDWNFDCEYYREDGETERAEGEWRFAWALEGKAIVDLWTYPRRAERLSSGKGPGGLGVTVRTYDPEASVWNIAWSDADGRFLLLKGRRSGDEIVQEGRREDGRLVRWIFSGITPTSFEWREEIASSDENTWRFSELMKCRRRN